MSTDLLLFVSLIILLFNSAAIFVRAGNNTITDEVYFDLKSEGKDALKGRIVIGVFGDALPLTSFNFVQLAKGFDHRQEKWHYKNCIVHRVVPDFLIQTGDVIYRDGRGGRSVYSPYFIDESFVHSHRAAGSVAMANIGADSNGSQFYITLTRARWLDNRNVVFGKVVSGMDVLNKISGVEVEAGGWPKVPIIIEDSGVLPLLKPYDLTESQMDSGEDVKTGHGFLEL